MFYNPRLAPKALYILGLEKEEIDNLQVELFWKGFRDYALQHEDCREKFLQAYKKLIPAVREAVKGTRLHLREAFYSSSDRDKIFNELRNTEIDVTIFHREKIYVGEAKRKEKLGFNGRNILAHQLVRQRVMVKVLQALTGDRRELVQFIICDRSRVKSIYRMEQLKVVEALDSNKPRVVCWQDVLKRAGSVPGLDKLQGEVAAILSVD